MQNQLLQAAGLLLALAALAGLLLPHGLSRPITVAVFLPVLLAGLVLVEFGYRRRRRSGRRAVGDLINGYRGAALAYLAARLEIADRLAAGPLGSSELAQELGAHAPSLHRVLRGLTALGLCAEEADGRFRLTTKGNWLRDGISGSLRGQAILMGEEYYPAWGGLLHSAMTGETAFDHVFGTSQWAHREAHPELNALFNEDLSRGAARAARAVLGAYDFSTCRTVADIGGGQGMLLAAILQTHPALTGILFDQPHVAAEAAPALEAAGVADRCRVEGGDFFTAVPAGADTHLLKSVIHDWDDERSLAILHNCRRALPAGGRLLLVERVLAARAGDHYAIMGDLNMLALAGGRERNAEEFRDLLQAAGFTLGRIIPTGLGLYVIEGLAGD